MEPVADRAAVAARALREAERAAGLIRPPGGPAGSGPERPERRLAESGPEQPAPRLAESGPEEPAPRLAGGLGHPMGAQGNPDVIARAIVLRQLALAPRSRHQLAAKLREKGCAEEVAARVLDRLADAGLIDDAAFAEMVVSSRQSSKGLARSALRTELRRKGVDDDVAEAAVASISPGAERLRAEELVAKKLRTMGGVEPTVQARRLAGLLMRKGYPAGLAYAVIRDAMENVPDLQRD